MTMHAVKIYKLNNLEWVFDDPGKNIYEEAFRAGADTMIDKILEHEHLDPEGDLVFQFSTGTWEPYEDTIYKLNFDIDAKNEQLKEGQGAFYVGPDFHSLWLSPTLLDYYDEPPGSIYVRIIGDHLDV